MKPIEYNNKAVEFEATIGTVAGSKKWTETHVRSYGGGGYIKDGTGYVSAPSVSSTNITKQEFWIITDKGEEKIMRLSRVEVRDGQKVTAILAYPRGETNGYWVTLVNHNAGRYWNIFSGNEFIDLFKLAPKIKNIVMSSLYHMAIFLALMGLSYLLLSSIIQTYLTPFIPTTLNDIIERGFTYLVEILTILVTCLLGLNLITKASHTSRIRKDLSQKIMQHLDSLVKSLNI